MGESHGTNELLKQPVHAFVDTYITRSFAQRVTMKGERGAAHCKVLRISRCELFKYVRNSVLKYLQLAIH